MFACRFVDDNANEFWGTGETMTEAFEHMESQTPDGEIDVEMSSDYITFFRDIYWDTTVKTVFFQPEDNNHSWD